MKPGEPWSEAMVAMAELARRGGAVMSEEDRALLNQDFDQSELQWSGGVRELFGIPNSLDVYVGVQGPTLSGSQQERLCEITKSAYYGFFDAATDGLPLTDTKKIKHRYGMSLEENYVEANPTFLRFACTYWTFKVLILESRVSRPDAVLTQLMHIIDGEIYPLFFPYDGPASIDPERRARDQVRLLTKFAPRIPVNEFLQGNPILIRDRKRQGHGRRVEHPVAPRKWRGLGWRDLTGALTMLLLVGAVFLGLNFWLPWWGALAFSCVLYAAWFKVNQHLALNRSSRTIARAYAMARRAGRSHPDALRLALETRFLGDETRSRVSTQFQGAIEEEAVLGEREQLKTLIRLMFWEEHGVPPDSGTQDEFERNLEEAVEAEVGKATRKEDEGEVFTASSEGKAKGIQALRTNLLGRLGGDQSKLQRLIDYERRRSPLADELELLEAVRTSLERDLG